MKSFTEFLSEGGEKEVFFTFGRFNPPSIEHEKLLERVAQLSKGKPCRIYASHMEGVKANPLPYAEKIKWMRKMFPKHARNIMISEADSLQAICAKLYEQGFTKITYITSEPQRLIEEATLNRHNGQKLNESFYNFKTISVISGIESNPDIEMRMRATVTSNDLEAFSRGLPEQFDQVEELFNAVRNGMGLKPTKNFRKHIQLESVSERREQYVSGSLFKIGDQVVVKETGEIGKITHCGSNYLIVEFADGSKHRKWLNAVELLEELGSDEVAPFAAPSPDVWKPFCPSLHTLGINRCELPQIRNEDREGLMKFMASKGVASAEECINPGMLKPTQSEYNPSKVDAATNHTGPDRALLVSRDGHILDGHHQWMAQLKNKAESVKIIRFKSPIRELVSLALTFPKSFRDFGSEDYPTESTTISKLRTLRAQ